MIVRPVTVFLISKKLILGELSLLRKGNASNACLCFRAKHEGLHSFVDVTTETKAQFFPLNHIHEGGVTEVISQEAHAIKELSPLVHRSVSWSRPSFLFFTDACSVSLPIVMYLTKP